jgi:UDPglucose 6-dehydrogenase
MNRVKVAFVGMTHLGLNSAAAAALRGHDVVGFDPDQELVEQLSQGNLPVAEPGLDAAVADNKDKLRFSSSLDDVAAADVIYVAPDVPTDDEGTADVQPVRDLVELVAPVLNPDATLVVLSQVQPGFSVSLGLPGNVLFYQVETLVFGQALDRALNPERYIVGCAEPTAPLPAKFKTLLESYDCPILPMKYESAELAKIAINCCLVASVTTANTLAELCEGIGADWSEIVPALRLDRRIGQYSYIEPGLGISGGNLERDLAAVVRMGATAGTDTSSIAAAISNSRYRKNWVLRQLHDKVLHTRSDPRVGVLGIAYKKDTASIKNSPSVALISSLEGYDVAAFDPIAKLPVGVGGDKVGLEDDALSVANSSDVVVIMTPWDEFSTIDPSELLKRMRGKILIDPFGVLDGSAARSAGLEYHTLGVCIAQP